MLSSFWIRECKKDSWFFRKSPSSSIKCLPQVCSALSRRALSEALQFSWSVSSRSICSAYPSRGLRDIESCLCAQNNKLYHMGIWSKISRSTLADANEQRNWSIHADFTQSLIKIARSLYAEEDLGIELNNTVYALDASTIDLCLYLFHWALFRSTNSAVRLLTLFDLHGNISTFIHISEGKLHDFNILDILIPGQAFDMAWICWLKCLLWVKRRILLHPGQAKHSVSATILPNCWQIQGTQVRSEDFPDRDRHQWKFFSAVETNQMLG